MSEHRLRFDDPAKRGGVWTLIGVMLITLCIFGMLACLAFSLLGCAS